MKLFKFRRKIKWNEFEILKIFIHHRLHTIMFCVTFLILPLFLFYFICTFPSIFSVSHSNRGRLLNELKIPTRFPLENSSLEIFRILPLSVRNFHDLLRIGKNVFEAEKNPELRYPIRTMSGGKFPGKLSVIMLTKRYANPVANNRL